MTLLEVRGLTGGYSGLAVVHDVSLRVEGGEFVALLGPNGAGKTTTLKSIYGLLTPMDGEILLANHSILRQPPHRNSAAGLGYVPEGRALAPSLTVMENLRLAEHWRADPFEVFPELEPLRARKAGVLSGGEQQMLAVARAIVTGPTVLLVDELSFGLAPILVDRLLERLRNMATRESLAVLLVEQHVSRALQYADRAYILTRGRITLERAAADLRADPALIESGYLGHQGEVPMIDG